MFKRVVCTLLCVTLIGCTTSPTVWSIGANSITGVATSNPESKTVELSLIESELEAHDDAGFLMPGHPYQSLKATNKSPNLGKVSFRLDDIKWETRYTGTISIHIKGELKEFNVWRKGNELRLTHYYRDWYGYPAQGLLLISYPLDVVIVGVSVVAYVLLIPFTMSSSNKQLNKDSGATAPTPVN